MDSKELQQFEYMRSKFQEMIKVVDQLSAQLKSSQDKYAELNAKIDKSLSEQSTQFNEAIKKLSQSQEKTNALLEEKERKLQSDWQKSDQAQKHNYSALLDLLGSYQKEISNCKAALQACAPLSLVNEFKSSTQDLHNKVNENKVHAHNILKADQSRISEINQLRSDLKNISDSVVGASSRDKEKEQILDKAIKDIKNIEQSLNVANQDLKKLYPYVDEKINAIPKPIIPSVEDLKRQLNQQLEPASLDAKNANLRSSNNEYKITVLEKKVEKINLLLTQQKQG